MLPNVQPEQLRIIRSRLTTDLTGIPLVAVSLSVGTVTAQAACLLLQNGVKERTTAYNNSFVVSLM